MSTLARYLKILADPRVPIVIATGPAGTGKTYNACRVASKAVQSRRILTRPAVSVDEEHGFLPGDLSQKMAPWLQPMTDNLAKHVDFEVCAFSHMRGRTFDDAFILADEMQNSTPSQMKLLLTRIGFESKLVVMGDVEQHERGFEHNGLADLLKRLAVYPVPGIEVVTFTDDDVQRHAIIKDVLRLYLSD